MGEIPSSDSSEYPKTSSRTLRCALCFTLATLLFFSVFHSLSLHTTKHHFKPHSNDELLEQSLNSAPFNITESAARTSVCDKPPLQSYPLKPPRDEDLPQVLLDYISFHKDARACLLNSSCQPNPKVIIATCPKEKPGLGLGDRMRGIPFALSVAIVTRRLFFINLSPNPFPLYVGAVPYSIDWTLPPNISINQSWPHLQWYWCEDNKACDLNGPHITKLSSFDKQAPPFNFLTDDVTNLFDDKPVITIASRMGRRRISYMYRNPHLNDMLGELGRRMQHVNASIFRLLFQPSELVKRQIQEVSFGTDDYISIHVRTGIDSNETRKERFHYISSHEEETVSALFKCLDYMQGDRKVRNLFLASDSPRTKKLFMAKGASRGYEVRLFGEQILHYRKHLAKKMPVLRDELCDGFATVFSDLFLLAGGKIMIVTGSNFATFARHLSANQLVRHFRPDDDLEDICQL